MKPLNNMARTLSPFNHGILIFVQYFPFIRLISILFIGTTNILPLFYGQKIKVQTFFTYLVLSYYQFAVR